MPLAFPVYEWVASSLPVVGLLVVFGSGVVHRVRRHLRAVELRKRVGRARLAAAEAAEHDASFDPEVVESSARELFVESWFAWQADDLSRIAPLVGEVLLERWELVTSTERQALKGWTLLEPIETSYVGLVNRGEDHLDRATVRIRVRAAPPPVRLPALTWFGSGSVFRGPTVELAEHWILARRDGRWIAAGVEPDSLEDARDAESLIPTPWADPELHDRAVLELAAVDTPRLAPAELVSSREGAAAELAADLSLTDPRFGQDVLDASIRQILHAWEAASEQTSSALDALVDPRARRALLGDDRDDARTAHDLNLEGFEILALDVRRADPTATLRVELSGLVYRQTGSGLVVDGSRRHSSRFQETWHMEMTGDPTSPWRLRDAEGNKSDTDGPAGRLMAAKRRVHLPLRREDHR